uniref:Uncharacterized protein n=1 Tax=Meloidogyne enterolobii TaxID=390850 RepID=A0A6V7THS5_MELEN|nr:unnamed protein product [Meloidogyne enterolobii]
MNFNQLSIHIPFQNNQKILMVNKCKSLNKFPSFELEKKWISAINNQIPVLLHFRRPIKFFAFCLTRSSFFKLFFNIVRSIIRYLIRDKSK